MKSYMSLKEYFEYLLCLCFMFVKLRSLSFVGL